MALFDRNGCGRGGREALGYCRLRQEDKDERRERNTSSNWNQGKHSSDSKLAMVGDKIFGKYDRALENFYPGS